ncbi:hypothetical protein J7L67_00025 [bacterium]|nr:hypothetical protein [bacterium]
MKKHYSALVLISLFTVLFAGGALYNPEKEKEMLSKFDKMILFQNKLVSQKNNPRVSKRFHPVDVKMISSPREKNQLLAKLIDNFFILNFYKNIVQFMRDDFKNRDLGKPFLSNIKFTRDFKCYVFNEPPEKDSDFNIENITKIYESDSAIKHFDQQFRISFYHLIAGNGIMLVRGKYVFIDSNLNGIPDAIYLMNKYKNSKRDFIPYLSLLAEGEDVLENSAYHSRYIDTMFVVLNYISDNFPFKNFLDETAPSAPAI